MIVTPKEQRLIQTIREAGCDIEFLLIHLGNLYTRQAELDQKCKRRANQDKMKRRADAFYQAYNEVMKTRRVHKNIPLYLVKNDTY